jgi:hypothetical protein
VLLSVKQSFSVISAISGSVIQHLEVTMPHTLTLPLTQIQPSQLYISAVKLARVNDWWQPPCLESLTPIPVVRLVGGNRDCVGDIVATDGHTRAFAAYRAGFTEVPVIWDTDDLDWRAYRICVDWCRAEGIRTVMDLAGRVVGPEDYQRLWLDRCRRMHDELA